MKIKKLLSDWLLVAMEEENKVTAAGILKTSPERIRVGTVLMAGPGRNYTDKYLPTTSDIVGKRIVFMRMSVDGHQQGVALRELLEKDHVLIRERDVLFTFLGEGAFE